MSGVVDLGPLIAAGAASGATSGAGGTAGDPVLAAPIAAGSHPIALLPVRLETCFAAAAGGGTELLVRVYPDQIHVDAHDEHLSAAEVEAGRQFWRADWRSGDDAERRSRAWRSLTGRFDPGRAAWIAEVTRPTNTTARPQQAVADTDEPAVAPVFPAVPTGALRPTPVARLLPAAWTATAYAGGQVVGAVTGRQITAPPAVGPDMEAPLVHADASGAAGEIGSTVAALDVGMNWLVDFDAAEALGMALRLPVPGPVDLLVVTGVGAADPDAGAAQLGSLLDAQRYTAGLAVLAPGTPTNNTEQVSSGWSSAASGSPAAPGPAPDGSVAVRIEGAFGLPAGHLGGIAGGDRDDGDLVAAATGRMLWPSTWGYWLGQFVGLGAGGLRQEDVDWAADHAARFVRPGGPLVNHTGELQHPLAAVRVGRQPYGLLPVTSTLGVRGDPSETRLGSLLAGVLGAGWRPAVQLAARVGRGDPADDLVDVLRRGATSDGVAVRRAHGPTFVSNALEFVDRRVLPAAWSAIAERTRALTAAAGVPATIDAALTVHDPTAWPVDLPLVGDHHGDELRAVLAADVDALAADASARPASVLGALVRHGLLREHATAASRLIADPAAAPAQDDEIYGFARLASGWTAQRDRTVDGSTVRARLANATDPASASIQAFRAAVATLADADAESLTRHLAGALDAAAYRVDAWATSLAVRRLAELRAGQPHGVLVGGYGWAENLQPGTTDSVTEAIAGEPGPLRRMADDPGFLHAPSIHQAQVAALLRNAHLAHGGGADDPFAITITSQRVRLAQRVFDAVRAGRSLGAVLGYLVERDLHERGLDDAVDNAREVSPLPGQESLPPAARRLDGLALHQLWADSEDHAIDHLVAGSQDAALRGKAAGVLRRLGATVDAAADLLQAEQVHHFAGGNLTAAVNTLGDIDRGLAPPPALDVIRTPRSGATVTHRVAVVIDPAVAPAMPTDGWARSASSPWAAGEPALDAWLAGRLGPAAGRRLTVVGADGTEQQAALADLDLAAIDLVRIAGAGASGLAELAARAGRRAATPVDRPQLRPGADLLDLLEVGRSLSLLIAASKPLDGSRLQPAHADPRPGIDAGEITARAAQAIDAAGAAAARLQSALAGTAASAVDAALVASWGFALGDAAVPAGSDDAAVRAAADRALQALHARLAEAAAVTDDGDEVAVAQRRLRAVLGPGFVALPRFAPPDAGQLAASRDDPALLGGDPLAAETWLIRMERVREPLTRLGVALREAEALGAAPQPLGVAQVPHRAGDAWAGGPAATYADGVASLVLVGAQLLTQPVVTGLLVDEFTELVPSANETTGVAFRYAPPAAMAPQAVLLAVPPVAGAAWTIGGLNQVLLETLDLVHARAVVPGELGSVTQFLPATMLAFNTDADVPSTNPTAWHGG